MNALYVLCLDDQREVLNAMIEDLSELEQHVELESCENAGEAWELIEEIDKAGNYLAVVVSDHIMPGISGVEFLITLRKDPRFEHTKKVLITGLATHQDTIIAINKAHLDNYIEKPWDKAELLKVVKSLLTKFMIESGIDYQKRIEITDPDTLFELLH